MPMPDDVLAHASYGEAVLQAAFSRQAAGACSKPRVITMYISALTAHLHKCFQCAAALVDWLACTQKPDHVLAQVACSNAGIECLAIPQRWRRRPRSTDTAAAALGRACKLIMHASSETMAGMQWEKSASPQTGGPSTQPSGHNCQYPCSHAPCGSSAVGAACHCLTLPLVNCSQGVRELGLNMCNAS